MEENILIIELLSSDIIPHIEVINFNYYSNLNKVMESEKEQKGYVFNPLLNLIAFWQDYLINWIEASRGFYENAIKANEHWLAAFWDPWLRAAGLERKETAKVD